MSLAAAAGGGGSGPSAGDGYRWASGIHRKPCHF